MTVEGLAVHFGVTLHQSRRVFLVADCSKSHPSAPVRIAGLPDLHASSTDRALPEPLAGRGRDHDVNVTAAGQAGIAAPLSYTVSPVPIVATR